MAKIIVSLTTYGENTKNLAPKAIKSLMKQTIKPDAIVLWLGYGTKVNWRLKLLSLRGLSINFCEDIGPSTKALPAMKEYPEDTIVTADDDILYPKNWLERLLDASKDHPGRIIAHRAHRITKGPSNKILPYNDWEKCVNPLEGEDWGLFPTGVGGVLYPSGSIPSRAFDIDELKKLTPNNDDIWLWATANLNIDYFNNEPPYVVLRDGFSRDLVFVSPEREATSQQTLGSQNVLSGGNDVQMKNIIDAMPELEAVLNRIAPRVV